MLAARPRAIRREIELEDTRQAPIAGRLTHAQAAIPIQKHESLRHRPTRRAAPREQRQNFAGFAALDLQRSLGKGGCADFFQPGIATLHRRLEKNRPQPALPAPGQQRHHRRLAPFVFGKLRPRHPAAPRIRQAIRQQAGQTLHPLGSVEGHIVEGQTHRREVQPALDPLRIIGKKQRPTVNQMPDRRAIPP